ncbi:hypothetical protein JCM3766R1_005133 [Sporobolomyces carnicolor]
MLFNADSQDMREMEPRSPPTSTCLPDHYASSYLNLDIRGQSRNHPPPPTDGPNTRDRIRRGLLPRGSSHEFDHGPRELVQSDCGLDRWNVNGERSPCPVSSTTSVPAHDLRQDELSFSSSLSSSSSSSMFGLDFDTLPAAAAAAEVPSSSSAYASVDHPDSFILSCYPPPLRFSDDLDRSSRQEEGETVSSHRVVSNASIIEHESGNLVQEGGDGSMTNGLGITKEEWLALGGFAVDDEDDAGNHEPTTTHAQPRHDNPPRRPPAFGPSEDVFTTTSTRTTTTKTQSVFVLPAPPPLPLPLLAPPPGPPPEGSFHADRTTLETAPFASSCPEDDDELGIERSSWATTAARLDDDENPFKLPTPPAEFTRPSVSPWLTFDPTRSPPPPISSRATTSSVTNCPKLGGGGGGCDESSGSPFKSPRTRTTICHHRERTNPYPVPPSSSPDSYSYSKKKKRNIELCDRDHRAAGAATRRRDRATTMNLDMADDDDESTMTTRNLTPVTASLVELAKTRPVPSSVERVTVPSAIYAAAAAAAKTTAVPSLLRVGTMTTDQLEHSTRLKKEDDDDEVKTTTTEMASRPEPAPTPTPLKLKKSHGRKTSVGHIPRPRNAFILFRSHLVNSGSLPKTTVVFQEKKEKEDRNEVVAGGGVRRRDGSPAAAADQEEEEVSMTTTTMMVPVVKAVDHKNVSKIVGEIWRRLGPDEKREWEELAEREKQQHREKYPDYKFRPKKSRSKKATTKTTTTTTTTGSKPRQPQEPIATVVDVDRDIVVDSHPSWNPLSPPSMCFEGLDESPLGTRSRTDSSRPFDSSPTKEVVAVKSLLSSSSTSLSSSRMHPYADDNKLDRGSKSSPRSILSTTASSRQTTTAARETLLAQKQQQRHWQGQLGPTRHRRLLNKLENSVAKTADDDDRFIIPPRYDDNSNNRVSSSSLAAAFPMPPLSSPQMILRASSSSSGTGRYQSSRLFERSGGGGGEDDDDEEQKERSEWLRKLDQIPLFTGTFSNDSRQFSLGRWELSKPSNPTTTATEIEIENVTGVAQPEGSGGISDDEEGRHLETTALVDIDSTELFRDDDDGNDQVEKWRRQPRGGGGRGRNVSSLVFDSKQFLTDSGLSLVDHDLDDKEKTSSSSRFFNSVDCDLVSDDLESMSTTTLTTTTQWSDGPCSTAPTSLFGTRGGGGGGESSSSSCLFDSRSHQGPPPGDDDEMALSTRTTTNALFHFGSTNLFATPPRALVDRSSASSSFSSRSILPSSS